MAKKRHGDIHHIRPTSRQGQDIPENKIEINIELHRAWHTLFHNDLVEEAVMKLETNWRLKGGGIKRSILSDKMREAWKILFGDASCDEAIKIIHKMFVDKDPAYLFPGDYKRNNV